MTVEKLVEDKYYEIREKRDAVEKQVDLQKVGEFAITVLEIFQETVRGQLVEKIYVALFYQEENQICLKAKEKRLTAVDCKKAVAEKLKKIGFENLNTNEQKYAQKLLEKYCEIDMEDNFMIISLKE